MPRTVVAILLAVLGCAALSLIATGQTSGKEIFATGEALLKQGKQAEAFEAFSMAAKVEPGNLKFQRKRDEVGVQLSDNSLSQATSRLQSDPVVAEALLLQSLTYNANNLGAKAFERTLQVKFGQVAARLQEIQAAIYRGDRCVSIRMRHTA